MAGFALRIGGLPGQAKATAVVVGVAIALALLSDNAVAQGSLGIGRPEPAIVPEGPLASLLFWIQQYQQDFYRQLTGALRQMRDDGSHVWLLAGLSFAYGVFHAAGPGHGKAVISSYMLANELAARRGIALAFASSLMQAVSAIALIGVLVFVLRGAGIRQGDLTRWLELLSYSGVTLLGAWLLYAKLARPGRGLSTAAGPGEHDCGHAHAPDPKIIAQGSGLRQAWAAIISVGLRPCSGAVIVLTFAFLNGLYAAGIASAFAMAVGTGMTVAVLAAMAVWAKDLAIYLGRAGDQAGRIHRWIEIGGAALVFSLGVLLLAASL